MTDYYSVLGVERGASESEIKSAYRTLARKFHPDVAADKTAAEAHFKEINEAYEVLSDPEKRRNYDRFGTASPGGSGFGGSADGFADIFDMFFTGMRAGGARPGGPARGADLRYDLEITLHEAFTGVERQISFEHMGVCETCKGSGARAGTAPVRCERCGGNGVVRAVRQTPLGQFVTQTPCTACGGEGRIVTSPCADCRGRGRREQMHSVAVSIPAGVEDGSRIRVSGYGEAGAHGGPPGDLHVFLRVAAHPELRRDGVTLYLSSAVPFTQAALGAELEVDSIDGPARFTIPAGTQSGQTFKIRGRGMPGLRGGIRGDLVVTVVVIVPTKLSRKQKELLEEFARIGGDRIEEKSLLDRVKDAFRAD